VYHWQMRWSPASARTEALFDVIVGAFAPSGRLPLTFV